MTKPNIIDQITKELLKIILTSCFKSMKEHTLSNISSKVHSLTEEGIQLAKSKMFKEAKEKFLQAEKLDPRFVGAKIQLIKVYQAQGYDMTALFICGKAIDVATNPKSRCRIFNLSGQICMDLFEANPSKKSFEQAIKFFGNARSSNVKDILPVWNLVLINILAHTNKFQNTDKVQYFEKAKQHFRTLLDLARDEKSNSERYLPDIISEAEKTLTILNDEWWDSQIFELKQCKVRQFDPYEANTLQKNSPEKWTLAIVLLSVMVVPLLIGAKHKINEEEDPSASQPVKFAQTTMTHDWGDIENTTVSKYTLDA
ncbi:tetratricopeptide repeat protein [Acaryochloris marina]|uniref:tetratricopeptide repeat protein n=1 Tax=Acaryochloris marina TaxID=155978 RepID=UPI0021C4B07B|nr:hypothetical protein [Acaryochloris marina]BDM83821.1 hypothetical protein AM10699_66820 [Acaryochloris marina MBIC10699]